MAGERTESLSQLNIKSDFAILSVQMDRKMTVTYLQKKRNIIHSRNKRLRGFFLTNAFNNNEKYTSPHFRSPDSYRFVLIGNGKELRGMLSCSCIRRQEPKKSE